MRILVVDDDEVLVEMLQYFIEAEGILVSTALDPPQALKQLELEEIDIVLSDLVMPNGGGVVLLENLHQNRPELPVIIMSGYGSQDMEFPRSQTSGFWRKGDTIERLIHLVKSNVPPKSVV